MNRRKALSFLAAAPLAAVVPVAAMPSAPLNGIELDFMEGTLTTWENGAISVAPLNRFDENADWVVVETDVTLTECRVFET